ncbi:unnamed protein product [Ectocarpus sp. CCAP 1310/34]|nr:unnamed protein product [Ectocarpus sp. CCAP 1310/34]
MVNVSNKRCGHAGCIKRPSSGAAGSKKVEFCSNHAEKDMVDLSRPRCGHPGCIKQPSFGTAGSKKAEFCSKHVKKDMVNLRDERCGHPGCVKRPSYGAADSKKREFCSYHAKQGMVDLSHKRCGHPACIKQSTFDLAGGKKAEFCSNHARQDMINLRRARKQIKRENVFHGDTEWSLRHLQCWSAEESIKDKEPGSVVADAASSGGWVAATEGQQEPLQPHGGGGGFLQQQARDGGGGPRQLLEGGWASRSGANPARPAGVGPSIGPDYGEARGLNPPGLDGQLIGNNERHAPVGNPNMPSSELHRLQYTSDEVQRGLQAFHFVTTAIVREADKAIVNRCETAKEILAELDKIYDPKSQGSKQALMKKMFNNFTIPTHSSRNPIEHLNSLELLYSRLREKGFSAEQPFVLAYFVGSLPPEYQQAKFLLETATALDRADIVRIVSTVHASLPEERKASNATALDRADIVRIVSTVHASLPEERKASNGQRRAEHALLASYGSDGAAATRRGEGVARGMVAAAEATTTMRVADCTESKPVRYETCKGYGHDKNTCPTEETVLVVEVPAGGTTLVGELRECLGCSTAKGLSKPIPNKTSTRAAKELQRVFVDLSGKARVQSLGGKWCTLIVKDDYTVEPCLLSDSQIRRS